MSTNYINKITDTAGTTHDIMEGVDTRIFRATCSTAAATAAKVATLDDDTGFSLTAGVRVAVTFSEGNSASTPTLRIDGSSTGTAKTIVFKTDYNSQTTGSGTTYNTWGKYETVIFTYDGTYWVNSGSGLGIYRAYNLANGKITAPSSPSSGNVLTYNGSSWIASAPSTDPFLIAIYGSTTFSDISSMILENKPIVAYNDCKLYLYTHTIVYDSSTAYHYFTSFKYDPYSSQYAIQEIYVSKQNVWASSDNNLIIAPSSPSSGDVLTYDTTNGWVASAPSGGLPDQTGNSGKYLTTNGTAASWAATSAATAVTIDNAPTSNSSNVVKSGGVYTAINNKVNRTTAVNVADTNYTTLMARGAMLMDSTTYDAVTDWSTYLVNGSIAWRYE